MLEAIQQIDETLLLAIQNMRVDFLNPIMEVYTSLGNLGIMWIVLSAAMLCHPKTRRAGMLSLLAMLLGMICTNVLLKHIVARPRPWLDVAGLTALVAEPDPNSFPSGHTCAAFAASMIWIKEFPWKWGRITGVVLAVLMGLSRLYVGVHYPTDVLVGAVVGFVCAWAVWEDYLLYEAKKRRRLQEQEDQTQQDQ